MAQVSHHGTPFVIIVDAQARILQADRRTDCRALLERIGATTGERLPAPVARVVWRHAMERGGDDRATVAVFGGEIVVSVVGLDDGGKLFACSLWQLRRQNVIENARRRFLLTTRECEMLERILAGEESAAIARALWVSLATVEWHTKRLLRKTDSQNRTQLAVRVLGWIPDGA